MIAAPFQRGTFNLNRRIMSLKVTTWNIKNSSRLIDNNPTAHELDWRRRVEETIIDIDPDILGIVEGPKGGLGITDFCSSVLNDQ